MIHLAGAGVYATGGKDSSGSGGPPSASASAIARCRWALLSVFLFLVLPVGTLLAPFFLQPQFVKETGHREGRGMKNQTTAGTGIQGRARSVPSGLPVKVALEGERRAELQGEVMAFDRFWMRVKLGASKATAREGSNVVLELANLEGG